MSEHVPRHVAIIGAGFTGTSALHQLVNKYPVERITVLESSGVFGPGFPYQLSESDAYLINNTNDTMCLDPSNRLAFYEWLQCNDRYAGHLQPKGHLPRRVYGEFLADTTMSTLRLAAEKGIRVDQVGHECLDLEEQPGGNVTVFYRDQQLDVDMVILTTGRCPDVDAFSEVSPNNQNYYPTHIPSSKLDSLGPDANVHILGSSLSAYDVVNQLFSAKSGCEFADDGHGRLRYVANGNQRKAVLCSRSGRLKKVLSRQPLPVRRQHFSAASIADLERRSTTLAEIAELIKKDASDAGCLLDEPSLLSPYAGCDNTASLNEQAAKILRRDISAASNPSIDNFLVDYLDDAQSDIWDLFATQKLTATEEARYRSRFETAMQSYAAPCPLPTARKILALMEAGRLSILKGVSVAPGSDGCFQITHDFGRESAELVINATGMVDRDVESESQSTLVRNLVARSVLKPYIRGGENAEGIDVDMSTGRCGDAQNIYAANMFLWGPGFFTSSARLMAKAVQRVLASAFDAEK